MGSEIFQEGDGYMWDVSTKVGIESELFQEVMIMSESCQQSSGFKRSDDNMPEVSTKVGRGSEMFQEQLWF